MPSDLHPPLIDDEDQALREIAAMDLALARKMFAAAMKEPEPQAAAGLALAYQRLARSVRQSVALRAKLQQDAENHRAAHTPLGEWRRVPAEPRPPARPDKLPPAEDVAVRIRRLQLRLALQTTIWSERESGELDRAAAARLRDRVDDLLRAGRAPDFTAPPLDRHVADLCARLGLIYDEDWAERPAPPDFWANPAIADVTDQQSDDIDLEHAPRRSSA